MKKHLALLTGLLCLLAVGVGADDDVLEGRHLRVHGQGVIQVTPDVAILQLGVEHRATTVAEAMMANNEAVARVLKALAGAHIADRDVQTMELNVHRMTQRVPHNGDQTLAGQEVFVVRNIVQARIRDLGHLGQVIDVAIEAGANEMRGLRFGLSEDRDVKDRAREAAVADARHRAEQLAR
ncbi:MAG: SIMPL domain-containing protein, partial [Gemmatimonadetes bacterium]|nr:SIMPL domain-containing protein [Gemmatimonadota bacterium]